MWHSIISYSPEKLLDMERQRVRLAGRLFVLVLAVHAGLLAWSAYRHSPVFNELGHVPAGLSHLRLGQFDLYSVNPPLVRIVAALGISLASPKTDWTRYSSTPSIRSEVPVGLDFLKANGSRSFWLFTCGRWLCIPFSLLGGYLCFRWASRLYGATAGLLAGTLWCFSPYVLGHAALITPDAHAAAMGLAAAYTFWRWLCEPCWDRALLAGVVLGFAELTKFTLLVFYPLWPTIWVVYRLSERQQTVAQRWCHEIGHLLVVVILSVFIINVGYGFEGSFQRIEDYWFQSRAMTKADSSANVTVENENCFAGTWLGTLPVPLPKNYLRGIDTQKYDFERGLDSYLRGQWADHGWWYYYLYALVIKEPLGTWCLMTLAIGVTILGQGYSASWRDELIVLAPCATILILVSSQIGFSVHSRYVIPALPFLFIWTSKVGKVLEMRPFTQKRLVMAGTAVLAITWSVGSSLAVYPHSLSYFNELAAILPTPADTLYPHPIGENDRNSGFLLNVEHLLTVGTRNGPHHLLDSNIDWGQDLFYLKDWLDRESNVKLDGLTYYNSYSAPLAGIPQTPCPPPGPTREEHNQNLSNQLATNQLGPMPGWYAMSVNCIYSRDRQYRYFLNFQPMAMAGYSIYIYHITIDEANQVRRELGLPELETEEREGEAKRGG